MHRFILGFPSQLIDHIDRNGLNNRRKNIRIANKSINALNSKIRKDNKTGIRNLSFDNTRGKWRVSMTLNSVTNSQVFKKKQDALHYLKTSPSSTHLI